MNTVQGFPIKNNTRPVKVINLSLGLSMINPYTGKPMLDSETWENDYLKPLCAAWKDSIDVANKHGVTVVIAAGNDAHSLYYDIPSGCPNIDAVVVEASSVAGKLSYYSTNQKALDPYGTEWQVKSVVVRAPGGDAKLPLAGEDEESGKIYSTINGGYGYMQGTSMATPHVAGVVALLYAMGPLNQNVLRKVLAAGSANRYGILNAYQAVNANLVTANVS